MHHSFANYRKELENEFQYIINNMKVIERFIIQDTQHPNKVLQQLNKFQYNAGTEEYYT